MSIGLHAKRYKPWRSQWSPRRKVVTVTLMIITTVTVHNFIHKFLMNPTTVPSTIMPLLWPSLCLPSPFLSYRRLHTNWVHCTLRYHSFFNTTTRRSLIGFHICFSLVSSILARLLFEPWTDHCCATATGFLSCVPLYRSFFALPSQKSKSKIVRNQAHTLSKVCPGLSRCWGAVRHLPNGATWPICQNGLYSLLGHPIFKPIILWTLIETNNHITASRRTTGKTGRSTITIQPDQSTIKNLEFGGGSVCGLTSTLIPIPPQTTGSSLVACVCGGD
jgi:hypothetical protein